MNSMELFTYIIIHIYVRKSGARICNTIALVNVVVFLSILNRWYLGDFTKMEGTQMKMFNFLWPIFEHYLPLTPTKNH